MIFLFYYKKVVDGKFNQAAKIKAWTQIIRVSQCEHDDCCKNVRNWPDE